MNKVKDDDFAPVPAEQLPGLLDSLKKMFALAIWPIIGYLFHPAYLIINTANCDRLGPLYLAGFGLGSLTLGIMCISIGVCFSMSVGTLVS
jgi:hypothetical protein